MVFVYPYIRHLNDWDILRSIEWLMDAFPQATVFTIGDALQNRENIPHKKRYHERGCDVTDKILTFAREIGGDAIYMNDDFFIGPNFDPYTNLRNGMLKINPEHSPVYQQACKHTLEFLNHYQYTTFNFECHQPMMFNSAKLIELFDEITWQQHNHFLKSLYLNVHTFMSMDAENLKIGRPDLIKANQLLDKYGCFSISDDFKQHNGPDFLNRC
jgi:hypothetical protein